MEPTVPRMDATLNDLKFNLFYPTVDNVKLQKPMWPQ